jgi:energy-converting hydrogenase Eha subunit F
MFLTAFDDGSLTGSTPLHAEDRGPVPQADPREFAAEIVEWEMSPAQVASLVSALALVFALVWAFG